MHIKQRLFTEQELSGSIEHMKRVHLSIDDLALNLYYQALDANEPKENMTVAGTPTRKRFRSSPLKRTTTSSPVHKLIADTKEKIRKIKLAINYEEEVTGRKKAILTLLCSFDRAS